MNSIQEKFKKRRRNQIIATTIFTIVMVTFLFASDYIEAMPIATIVAIAIVIVVVVIGVGIFSFNNWRCPNCNKYLGKSLRPKFCQSCGEKLV